MSRDVNNCDNVIPDVLALDHARLRELMVRSPRQVMAQTLFNVLGYLALGYVGLAAHRWWVWATVWWFQGIVLSGFLGASHDCAHGVFAGSPRGNHIAGALWSSAVLFNFSLYKYFHLEHHHYTSVEGDTEPGGLFPSAWAYFKSLPTTAFFVSFWKMSALAMVGRFPHFVRSPRARMAVKADNVVQFAWIVGVVILTAIWPKQIVLLYWCPILVYFPMVFWTSLPEHYGCDPGSSLINNTRSTVSNWLFRYSFWNGNFHAEHHVYPSVPSHNLPELHRLIGRHFAFQERSYVLFHLNLVWTLLRDQRVRSAAVVLLDATKRVEYSVYDECNAATSSARVAEGSQQ